MAAYCDTPAILKLSLPAGPSVDLMDDAQGFRVSELNLGYPAVREDINLAPGRHGTLDYTRLFGERAVTITGALVPSKAGSRQKAWHALAPFLDPTVRSTLTYQVDDDVAPRTMTVRAAQASGPFDNPVTSMVSMGFKCADPLAYDATQQQSRLYVAGLGAGRAYNLSFSRAYPGGGQTSAVLYNYGDFAAFPVLRFYGPITGPAAAFYSSLPVPVMGVVFQASYTIPGGHYVEVNTRERTAYYDADRTQPVTDKLDWTRYEIVWPWVAAGAPTVATSVQLTGGGYSTATQLVVLWNDPYLV